MKNAGLVDMHAYSLIGTNIVTLKNGKEERLLQIRNPWARFEWNGKWNDKDPLWDEYKSQVPAYENKDDGNFFMRFDDFDKFFYLTSICFFNHEYEEASVNDQHAGLDDPNPFGLIEFKLSKDTNSMVVVTLDQCN